MFELHEEDISYLDLQDFYDTGALELDINIPINSYTILRSSNGSAIARHKQHGLFVPLTSLKSQAINGIAAKDGSQRAFIDSLKNKDIILNACIGTAGTGKSTLALAYALDELLTNRKRIYMTKPTTMVGNARAFGPVPGDIDMKYRPFLSSYEIILEKMMGKQGKPWLDIALERGDIKFIPIEFARGATFDDCTFIIDEVQNLGWHELNTIVSRMGNNTKLIILGDLNQIDSRTHLKDTGIYQFINSETFKCSPITSCMHLTKQYRSPITQLVADVDEELRNDRRGDRKEFHRNSREPELVVAS